MDEKRSNLNTEAGGIQVGIAKAAKSMASQHASLLAATEPMRRQQAAILTATQPIRDNQAAIIAATKPMRERQALILGKIQSNIPVNTFQILVKNLANPITSNLTTALLSNAQLLQTSPPELLKEQIGIVARLSNLTQSNVDFGKVLPQLPVSSTIGGTLRLPRGLIQAAIMDTLLLKGQNGNQIIQQISNRSNGSWVPKAGVVYPTLKKMTQKNLVQINIKIKTYELTELGYEYASTFHSSMEKLFENLNSIVIKDELTASTQDLLEHIDKIHTDGSEQQKAAVVKHLQKLQTEIKKLLG